MKTLNTPYANFELIDDVLMIEFKPDLEITLEVAQRIVADRKIISDGKAYPGLGDVRFVKSATKEARAYFELEESQNGVLAGAMLVDSVFSTFLVNFFLKVTKQKMPSKMFTDKQKALKWLAQFKSK
ncbi:MAG: STAS/SEC14 domain-containing protein [Bacteroidia bacterium]